MRGWVVELVWDSYLTTGQGQTREKASAPVGGSGEVETVFTGSSESADSCVYP